jgi:hypothetical protein
MSEQTYTKETAMKLQLEPPLGRSWSPAVQAWFDKHQSIVQMKPLNAPLSSENASEGHQQVPAALCDGAESGVSQ